MFFYEKKLFLLRVKKHIFFFGDLRYFFRLVYSKVFKILYFILNFRNF